MRSGTAPQPPDAFRHRNRRMRSGTGAATFRHLKLNPNGTIRGDGTMRYETYTLDLHDNDMMMRELSSAEMDEVVGGVGTALVQAVSQSGAGSTLSVTINAALATSNTSAAAAIAAGISATGANNAVALLAAASVA
jgi:hypothetical protein